MVTVDACRGCRIFIGPTAGSVFLRDCACCAVAAAAQQVRLRGCARGALALHSRTRPAVEGCSALDLSAFGFPYDGMAAHMRACGLPPTPNLWHHPYDFTPPPAGAAASWRIVGEGSGGGGGLLPADERLQRFFFGGARAACRGDSRSSSRASSAAGSGAGSLAGDSSSVRVSIASEGGSSVPSPACGEGAGGGGKAPGLLPPEVAALLRAGDDEAPLPTRAACMAQPAAAGAAEPVYSGGRAGCGCAGACVFAPSRWNTTVT